VAETYYDITDLIAYVASHGGVTGIQRVEFRLLSELAESAEARRDWCLAAAPDGRGYRAWPLTDIFSGELDPIEVLARLADGAVPGRWPSRRGIRRHLNRRGVRGWRRITGKLEIYARAVLRPGSLEQRGLIAPPTPSSASTGVCLPDLPRDATLVLLGAGWNDLAVTVAARRHARAGGRVMHLVYDLIPLVRPDYFHEELQAAFARHFAEAATYASGFVCISRHTQADLNAFLADRGRSISATVVPLAHEFGSYPRNARGCQPHDRRLLALGSSGRPFFLCVGTLEIRKNGAALLDAWLRLRPLLGDATPNLVFCGRRGWKVEPFFNLLAEHAWLRDRVRLLPAADDADLAYLHEHSIGSIYPSLYEGWGLPVGEAAWFGRTCITSRSSSLPEVCGLLAEYVDPRSPAEITAAVLRTATESDWRAWRERLIAAAPLRTWRDVASEFRGVVSESGFAVDRGRRAA